MMKVKLIKIVKPYLGVNEHVVYRFVDVPMMPGPGVLITGAKFSENVTRVIIDTLRGTVVCETPEDVTVVFKRETDEPMGLPMTEEDRVNRKSDLEERIQDYVKNGWQYEHITGAAS
jgi:hypothetical protein